MLLSDTKQTLVLAATTVVILLLVTTSFWFGVFTTIQSIVVDRFFTTQPISSDILIIDIDEESLAMLGQWPWPRSTHAQLLDAIGSARVVGFDVLFTEPSQLGETDDQLFTDAIGRFKGAVVLPAVIDEQSGRVTYPIDVLRDVSDSGFVNTTLDRDGVVRRTMLTRAGVQSFVTIVSSKEISPEQMRIYYFGPAKTYTTISYYDVYSGAVPAEIFSNKTILVGASASGLGDTYQTSFGPMPGVEVHANSIETLWSGKILLELSPPASALSFLLLAGLILLLVIRIRSVALLGSCLFVVLAALIGVFYAGFNYGLITPLVYWILLTIVLSGTLVTLQYLFTSKEKQFIRNSFSQYVAPEVISELYASPEKLTLGGETRTLSILFSDIRGFTTLSESLTPQELMQQLNEYLEEMSEAIMGKRGLVDKYIGDAVMAFWGAPLQNANHAKDACESVLVMMKALQILNTRWEQEGRPQFKIGVGVSTGEVVVGNMGSRRRFNYSIIGDEVNFSARIEGLTKQYGVECLIGEATYQGIKDQSQLRTRELDYVMVKGKQEPRRIYQLITTDMTYSLEEVIQSFAIGRKHYLAGNFKEAIASFQAALDIDATDGPSQVFLQRSKDLLATPPENWTGVFEFKTK